MSLFRRGFFHYVAAPCIVMLFAAFVACGSQSSAPAETYDIVWKGESDIQPANPEKGWSYYDISANKAYLFDGSSWVVIAKDGASVSWRGAFSSPSDAALASPQLNWAYYNTTDKASYIWDGSAWKVFARSGIDGVSMSWRGELDAAPADPQLLWAYYNKTDGRSYIWSGTAWNILSEAGARGDQGEQGVSICWKGSFASAPASPQLNWAYYNTTDNCSYIFDGSAWTVLVKGSGPSQQSSAPFSAYAAVQGGFSGRSAFCVVTGRNLDKASSVFLQKAGASAKIIANKITYQSTAEINCMFPLGASDYGTYDIHVSDGSSECVISNGFLVNRCERSVNVPLQSRFSSSYYLYTKPAFGACPDGSCLVAYTTFESSRYGIKVLKVKPSGAVTDLGLTYTNSGQFLWTMSPDSDGNPVIALTTGTSSPAMYVYRYNGTWTGTLLESSVTASWFVMNTLNDASILLSYKGTSGKAVFYHLDLSGAWTKLGEFALPDKYSYVQENFSILSSAKGAWFVTRESVTSIDVDNKSAAMIFADGRDIGTPGIASDGYFFFSVSKQTGTYIEKTLKKTDASGTVALSMDMDAMHFTMPVYLDAACFIDQRGILFKSDGSVLRPSAAVWNNTSYRDYVSGLSYRYLGLTATGAMRFLEVVGDEEQLNIVEVVR